MSREADGAGAGHIIPAAMPLHTATNQSLPTELLQFRLSRQLARLKELLSTRDNFSSESDNFDVYQRIVSWFIMGRLSKLEFDLMLEEILCSAELRGKIRLLCLKFLFLSILEAHNRLLEMMVIFYCMASEADLCEADKIGARTPLTALTLLDEGLKLLLSVEESQALNVVLAPLPASATLSMEEAPLLSALDEAILLETLKIPMHEHIEPEVEGIPGISYRHRSSYMTWRTCTDMNSLPSHELIRERVICTGLELCPTLLPANLKESELMQYFQDHFCDEEVALMVLRFMEDWMKTVLEKMMVLRFGDGSGKGECLMQPPESYLFPFLKASKDASGDTTDDLESTAMTLSQQDLEILLQINPWLFGEASTAAQIFAQLQAEAAEDSLLNLLDITRAATASDPDSLKGTCK